MKINNGSTPRSLGKKLTAATLLLSITGAAFLASPLFKAHDAYADVSGAYTYSIADGEATITDYDAQAGGLSPVIPTTLGGYDVRVIDFGAFAGKDLTAVTIPEGITSINSGAFASNLISSVSLPNSLESIGSSVFSGNPLTTLAIGTADYTGGAHLNIASSAFSNMNISSLTLGANVLSIGSAAFYDNDIVSLVVPGNVTTLGANAFMSNPITNLTLEEGITTIDYSVFNQTQLTSVTIPNSVTTINPAAFNIPTLSSVTIGTADYTGPALLTIGSGIFNNASLTSLTLGNNVLGIEGGAFMGSNITSLTIPDSVTTISGGAFNNTPLQSLTLGNSVTLIDDGSFYGTELESVVIPNSVVTIGNGAFGGGILTSLTLGNSVTTIRGGAFVNNKLTSVTIPASVTSIGIQAFAQNNLRRVIIEGTPTLDTEVFSENGLDRSTIPIGLTRGSSAWYDYYEQNASLVNLYATDPNATYTDTLYVDTNDSRVVGGYIVNPAALTTTYKSSTGATLHTPTYQTSPLFNNYLIANTLDVSNPANPSVDFSSYYRLGDSVSTSAYDIDGFPTPTANTITLTAFNDPSGATGTTQAYVYTAPSNQAEGAGSTAGTPNTGLLAQGTALLVISLITGLALITSAIVLLHKKRS